MKRLILATILSATLAPPELTVVHHYKQWDTDYTTLVYSTVIGDNGSELARFDTAEKARAWCRRKYPKVPMYQASTADLE